jgi:gas vesicle protein
LYVVLTFNTDAGKTPIYLSFNDLVSYTIDAAKEQLWAELQKYVDETKEDLQKYVDESTEELQKYIDETKEELNNSTDLKASKVKENNTKDKIAILTAEGDL